LKFKIHFAFLKLAG